MCPGTAACARCWLITYYDSRFEGEHEWISPLCDDKRRELWPTSSKQFFHWDMTKSAPWIHSAAHLSNNSNNSSNSLSLPSLSSYNLIFLPPTSSSTSFFFFPACHHPSFFSFPSSLLFITGLNIFLPPSSFSLVLSSLVFLLSFFLSSFLPPSSLSLPSFLLPFSSFCFIFLHSFYPFFFPL